MTETEKEDLQVTKRRAEGTPCNKENFLAWKISFEAQALLQKQQDNETTESNKKKSSNKNNQVDKSERFTGFQLFTTHQSSLDVIEAAAENAECDSDDDDNNNVQEDLFDDDVDLDDMDFDDDDEDEDEDEIDEEFDDEEEEYLDI